MAQLKKVSVLETNGQARVSSVLINTARITATSVEDVGGNAQFTYDRKSTYLVDDTTATIYEAISNYDANVVVPLQVVSIDDGLIGAEVKLCVDKIVVGYVDGENSLLITYNEGILQQWVVSDTLDEIEELANLYTAVDGDIVTNSVTTVGDVVVGGNTEVAGNSTVTGDSDVGGDLSVDGDVVADSVTTVGNMVAGGEFAAAGAASFLEDVDCDKDMTVGEDLTVVGDVITNSIDTPSGEEDSKVLDIGVTNAEAINVGAVGIKSETLHYATFARPGIEDIDNSGEGEMQELTLVYLTRLTSGDAVEMEGILVDGDVAGQLKKIWFISDGGANWVVYFSSVYAITFDGQGQWATLIWNGTIWEVLDLGLCDGSPTIGLIPTPTATPTPTPTPTGG